MPGAALPEPQDAQERRHPSYISIIFTCLIGIAENDIIDRSKIHMWISFHQLGNRQRGRGATMAAQYNGRLPHNSCVVDANSRRLLLLSIHLSIDPLTDCVGLPLFLFRTSPCAEICPSPAS